MTLVRFDPFRGVATLQDRINRIFDDALVRSRDNEDDINLCAWKPAVDIYDNTDSIVIKAELPGVEKKDVSVEIKDNVITLKGERVIDNEVKEDNYYRKERSFGTFQRAFTLPDAVSSDKVRANFKDGVLKIEIPKPEEKKPKQITVNVE
ncbi:MAG: Hsp20/alpha crystallin family protein [Desulfobacteraceae bacterium]|nr:MAG: Hsp20/alpha crystallin family protein [Desulfobacteraceae bacterium]